MKIALQMDALASLNKKYDSTLYLAAAAARRGYELFSYQVSRLDMEILGAEPHISATGNIMTFHEKSDELWTLGAEETRDLSAFDIILMRQDPPFDLGYITATYILEHLTQKVRVLNDPVGVRNAPEKLLTMHVAHLMPPTLVTRDLSAINDFRKRHGDIIIKPLHGFAGHGIFHMRLDDDNLSALIETLATMNSEPWMIQKFLPVEKLGDKRIIMLDGDAVGTFTRFPLKGDIRGNMRVGGRAEAASMTKRDEEICAVLKPLLRERGLFLAGIDVIGDYLTEINVTSPTGLVVADQFTKPNDKESIAEKFWDRV